MLFLKVDYFPLNTGCSSYCLHPLTALKVTPVTIYDTDQCSEFNLKIVQNYDVTCQMKEHEDVHLLKQIK